MANTKDNFKKFAPIILRYGIGLVYLWFGISQLLSPENFVGYLPDFIFNSSYATTFVIINGIFEIIASILLLSGIFTRIVAILLALHLLAITIDVGYGEIGVRDFGLTIATITIFLWGEDEWCMEKKWKKTNN
jgi:uncharacterized membrane protein YphA (DoxX/SURF4 family)